MQKAIIIFLATGLYVGRIPKAPGTFGALLGIPVACLLHSLPAALMFPALAILILASVIISGMAATILGDKDPPSVVLDEVAGMAVSLCWFPCNFIYALACFTLFRLFDIWKPGPVNSLQNLPGGWGVVMDDILAGIMAGAVVQAGVMLSHAW